MLQKNSELIFWISAVLCLAFSNPGNASHFTLCPLKLAGITWCPGCGTGHAIAWLLHGDINNSFHAHWFGIPALAVILYRIYDLGRALPVLNALHLHNIKKLMAAITRLCLNILYYFYSITWFL